MRAAQLIVAVLVLTGALLVPAAVRAEPYLMVRTGAKCSACHTNETGGGKRTAFAHIHAHDILQDVDVLPIPKGVKPFNGEVNQYISIGADLRVRNTTVFTDPQNSRGQVGPNQAFRKDTVSNDTDVNEFRTYLQVDLWPDLVTFYADESFQSGADNREAFGLIHGLKWDTYVKAGRMVPAFGLRVLDDQAFIRARSGFTFQNPDEGVEIGFGPGPFFLASTIANGDDDPGDKDVLATVNGYGVFEDIPVVRSITAGASFARQSDKRHVSGFYGGSNLWRFTYLGEIDVISDRTLASQTQRDHFAAYGELDFLVFDWLNLRGTFDFVQVSHDSDQTRYAIGAEPFVNRFIQPRIQYRINNGPPGGDSSLNQDELVLELHFFF
jgi:hypothetical protein